MDEKTEQLRDLFVDVTRGEAVTEQQRETPGTLADDESKDERIRELIEAMDERYGLPETIDREGYLTVAYGFYDGQTDEELATELSVSAKAVRRARFALHLVHDADHEGPVDPHRIREAVSSEVSAADLVSETDADEDAIRAQLEAARATGRMRQSSHRFRDQFDELLGDADVADHMPDDLTEDGLREATEDMEIETGF